MEEKAEEPTEINKQHRLARTNGTADLRCYDMAQQQDSAYPIKETQRR
ncbi:MAG: hypothetical protein ACKPKO_61730 [Candidatus Fonsibacter sp.]